MKAVIENINESAYPAAILPVLAAVAAAWSRDELEILMKKAVNDPQYSSKSFDLEYSETCFIVRDQFSRAVIMWADYNQHKPEMPVP